MSTRQESTRVRSHAVRAIVLALWVCGTSAPGALSAEPRAPETRTYREVDGRELSAHVFAASTPCEGGEPASAVLLFHGGGWSVGSPEWTFEAARRFSEHGMVAISVQYRLSTGEVTPIDALADVCAAFAWVREHAGDLGVDPARVAGYGVSAGGHLVASAATVGCPNEDGAGVRSEPDALLLWSPALDMARDGWFAQKLQGRATANAYSPVEHVRASTPPTSIVQGEADTLTPLPGARRFCVELARHGPACDLNVYEGVGHLLTRNLEYQEGDFDPDPDAVASGIAEHLEFLREQGFISAGRSEGDRARAHSLEVVAFLEQLDALREEADIPGLSVAVLKDRRLVVAAGLGLADVERGVPATADTAYDVASVAKPLSAVVALRLVEEGTLDLDRPLIELSEWGDFCTEFGEQPTIFARDLRCRPADHTLRHLLSHTATGTPGTRFSYNPILYSWASRPMMDAAGGEAFSNLVERYVFEPAGMSRSARKHRGLALPDDLARRVAPPYRIDDTGDPIPSAPRPPQGDGAAGGVVTTVLDLAQFDIALDEGVLISAGSRVEMLAPTESIEGDPLPYGLGWFVQTFEGTTLVWHSGWWEDAYSALYLKVPAQELSLILLANSEGIWWDNPPERAEVEQSRFAQLFLATFADRQEVK